MPTAEDTELREEILAFLREGIPADATSAEVGERIAKLDRLLAESLALGVHVAGDPEAEALFRSWRDSVRAAMARFSKASTASVPATSIKVGRNDPCPCGSGRKWKKCHGSTATPPA